MRLSQRLFSLVQQQLQPSLRWPFGLQEPHGSGCSRCSNFWPNLQTLQSARNNDSYVLPSFYSHLTGVTGWTAFPKSRTKEYNHGRASSPGSFSPSPLHRRILTPSADITLFKKRIFISYFGPFGVRCLVQAGGASATREDRPAERRIWWARRIGSSARWSPKRR